MALEIRSETSFHAADRTRLARFGRAVLAALDRSGWDVSVLIVDDRAMRQLNRVWRGHDRTTDVLSFPAQEKIDGGGTAAGDPGGLDRLLGDVVISAPRAAAQARRFGVSQTEELNRLLVHGILHLMGYDHVTATERREMRALENRLLTGAHRAKPRAARTAPGLRPARGSR
ncbi:MAG: rRNA maturation RNase YbeY [bacterium]